MTERWRRCKDGAAQRGRRGRVEGDNEKRVSETERGEAKQGLWGKDIVNSEDGSDGEEH